MGKPDQTLCTAFQGPDRIASGALAQVAAAAKAAADANDRAPVLIFDDSTSRQIEVDFRGTIDDVLGRLAAQTGTDAVSDHARSPGRPKLGVVAREVTLLPRHWDWLKAQPGGASVALRRLVDEARHANRDKDRVRQSQETAYRFISVMAGDRPGFEEAARALFAGDRERFAAQIRPWPADIRDHAERLAAAAFRDQAATDRLE